MSRTTATNHIPPSGVYAAAVTPFRERSNYVDLGAAMEILDFLEASPAKGISIFGTTGNFLHFDVEEREKLVSFGVKRCRKPVIVGIAHSTLDVTVYLAEQAAGAGASAALVLPPYYFRYNVAQLEEFYLRLGEKAAGVVPLYLYNIPFFTSALPVEVSERLLRSGMYVGIKDSSGKPEYLEALKDTGATLLVGNDNALCVSRKQSAVGVISGCAAALPELICARRCSGVICSSSLAGWTSSPLRLAWKKPAACASCRPGPRPVGLVARRWLNTATGLSTGCRQFCAILSSE
jgi:4-hydroxy-tetrahydrodipicolinate synthase